MRPERRPLRILVLRTLAKLLLLLLVDNARQILLQLGQKPNEVFHLTAIRVLARHRPALRHRKLLRWGDLRAILLLLLQESLHLRERLRLIIGLGLLLQTGEHVKQIEVHAVVRGRLLLAPLVARGGLARVGRGRVSLLVALAEVACVEILRQVVLGDELRALTRRRARGLGLIVLTVQIRVASAR